MATLSYMPNDDGGKADLLDHIAATAPRYTEILGLSPDDLAERQADADAFRYTLHAMNDMQAYAQHWTEQKNLLRDGGDSSGD